MEEIKITEDLITETRKGIPPYKLSCLMKTASKVTDMLAKIPDFMVTYDDIEFILFIIQTAVRRARLTHEITQRPDSPKEET